MDDPENAPEIAHIPMLVMLARAPDGWRLQVRCLPSVRCADPRLPRRRGPDGHRAASGRPSRVSLLRLVRKKSLSLRIVIFPRETTSVQPRTLATPNGLARPGWRTNGESKISNTLLNARYFT